MVFPKDYPKFDTTKPDDFDPKNPYADPVALYEYREWLVREKWVAIETAKIYRERVKDCYRREGVNHYQKCQEHVRRYLESIKGIGWGKNARPHYMEKQEEP